MFFADVVKCFDKLWLKGCLLEMCNLSYGPNILKILHEINRDHNYNTSRKHRKYTGERNGKTSHDIWTHHVLCRNIHS